MCVRGKGGFSGVRENVREWCENTAGDTHTYIVCARGRTDKEKFVQVTLPDERAMSEILRTGESS